jgi:DUF1680 family protein
VRLFDAEISPSTAFIEERRPDLLGGITVLKHAGFESTKPLASKPLYEPFSEQSLQKQPVQLTLIPYYAWANRGPDQMEVWLPISHN